jgi:hypothetical protein
LHCKTVFRRRHSSHGIISPAHPPSAAPHTAASPALPRITRSAGPPCGAQASARRRRARPAAHGLL